MSDDDDPDYGPDYGGGVLVQLAVYQHLGGILTHEVLRAAVEHDDAHLGLLMVYTAVAYGNISLMSREALGVPEAWERSAITV